MAISLETRVPFLDHRVAELGLAAASEHEDPRQRRQMALRQVLYQHVPRELIERTKAGFALPIGSGERVRCEWAENLLDEARLQREDYLKPELIRQDVKQHLGGLYDWTPRL